MNTNIANITQTAETALDTITAVNAWIDDGEASDEEIAIANRRYEGATVVRDIVESVFDVVCLMISYEARKTNPVAAAVYAAADAYRVVLMHIKDEVDLPRLAAEYFEYEVTTPMASVIDEKNPTLRGAVWAEADEIKSLLADVMNEAARFRDIVAAADDVLADEITEAYEELCDRNSNLHDHIRDLIDLFEKAL